MGTLEVVSIPIACVTVEQYPLGSFDASEE